MAVPRALVLCSFVLAQCAALDDLCSRHVEVVSKTVANQGKFAVWDASLKVLLYVDAPACSTSSSVATASCDWSGSIVYAFNPVDHSTHEVMSFKTATVGSIMPRRDGGGAVMAITDSDTSTIRTMDIDPITLKGSNLQVIVTLPSSAVGKFNNGNCDAEGRYWVGTFNYGHEELWQGKVWVLRPAADGHGYGVSVGIDHIGHPNGLFWRNNGTELLFSRMYLNVVEKYDYSMAEGKVVGKGSILAREPASEKASDDSNAKLFDSMCGFKDGSFLVTGPHLGVLRYFGADGQHKCDIKMPIAPATFVASCAFVGDDLYIPTGRNGGSPDGPGGWLYRIRGVAGGVEANSCDVKAPAVSLVV